MVHDHHEPCAGVPWRAIERAGAEFGVGYVVGGFEVVGEFIEDVGHAGCVGAIVWEELEKISGERMERTHKHDKPLSSSDEILECRPIRHSELGGGHVGIVRES